MHYLLNNLSARLAICCALVVMLPGCNKGDKDAVTLQYASLDSVAENSQMLVGYYSNAYIGFEFSLPDSLFFRTGSVADLYGGSGEYLTQESLAKEISQSTLFVAESKDGTLRVRGKYQYMYGTEADSATVDAFIKDMRRDLPKGIGMAGIKVEEINTVQKVVDGATITSVEFIGLSKDNDVFLWRALVVPTRRGIVTVDIVGKAYDFPQSARAVEERITFLEP